MCQKAVGIVAVNIPGINLYQRIRDPASVSRCTITPISKVPLGIPHIGFVSPIITRQIYPVLDEPTRWSGKGICVFRRPESHIAAGLDFYFFRPLFHPISPVKNSSVPNRKGVRENLPGIEATLR